jgi:hypothetical protein
MPDYEVCCWLESRERDRRDQPTVAAAPYRQGGWMELFPPGLTPLSAAVSRASGSSRPSAS